MNVDSVKGNRAEFAGKAQSKLEKKYSNESSSKPASNPVIADKLELSDEARTYLAIQNRIRSGFYDKPDVLNEVAIKLSEELNS